MVVGIQSRPGTGCYLSVQLGTPGVDGGGDTKQTWDRLLS